jgi:Hom_end-associated Hint
MPNYQQLQQQLVDVLLGGATSAATVPPGLPDLVKALPYYGDPDFAWALRAPALLNLLAVNMPNSTIAPHPSQAAFGYLETYTYTGSYSGYQSFFFSGIAESSAASNLAQAVQAQDSSLDGGWWGRYGVAVLTDAIRQVLGFNLDTGKLSGDLENFNKALLPCLTASCIAVFQNGFTPTANVLAKFTGTAKLDVYGSLGKLLPSAAFVANVNTAISQGGDSATAATWLLFNLWITLKALGVQYSDVDAVIQNLANLQLSIPPQIGPTSWRNGGYTSWYTALSGSDLAGSFRGPMTEDMPESIYDGSPNINYVLEPNGYSTSLCFWGGLSWYQPPSNSCFGAGTRVLMADGSVRPIEDIQIGDAVRSDSGMARVLLVESPLRSNRPLYRINHLDVYATAGHPFRLAADCGAAHCAIDPWTLADTVPTVVFDGIDALVSGARLAGLGPAGPQAITVGDIERLEAQASDKSCVYDLILERVAGKIAAYYVGGPESFLAVDAETSDGSREPMATVAIVTAMETAIESCRRSNRDDARLAETISRIDVSGPIRLARAAAWSAADQPQAQLSTPDPDFFLQDGRWLLQDGKWDNRASLLGTYLVRRFGRTVRRETAMGWRGTYQRNGNGDRLTLVLHDLIFVGIGGKISSDPLEIEFRLRGWGSEEDTVRTLTVAASASAYARIVHSIVDFGPVPSNTDRAALMGTISQSGRPIGAFRADVFVQAVHGAIECFLFAPEGHGIGLVTLEPRIGSEADFLREQELAKGWTDRHALALAQSLGQQIGAQLAAELDKAGPGAMGPPSPSAPV